MLGSLIMLLGRIYLIILLGRVLLSWVPIDPSHPFVQVLYQLTEPVLRPIRQLLPASSLDFSPIVAMLLIQVLTIMLASVLA